MAFYGEVTIENVACDKESFDLITLLVMKGDDFLDAADSANLLIGDVGLLVLFDIIGELSIDFGVKVILHIGSLFERSHFVVTKLRVLRSKLIHLFLTDIPSLN